MCCVGSFSCCSSEFQSCALLSRKVFLRRSRLLRTWTAEYLGCPQALCIAHARKLVFRDKAGIRKGSSLVFHGRLTSGSRAPVFAVICLSFSSLTGLGCAYAHLWRGADKWLPPCLYFLLVNCHSILQPVPEITFHTCVTPFLL